MRGPWRVLSVAISFLGLSLALRGSPARPGGQPTAQSAAVRSARTIHLLGLALLGLIPGGAAPTLGEALREEPGAPAGVAGGAGSQLCSLPGAGVALHLAWEGGKVAVGYGPKALPRAQGKLKVAVLQLL